MLEKLFEQIESDLLTDEVKLQMSTLFETAVNEAIDEEKTKLEEANRGEINEFKDKLTEQIDEYMAYIVEEIVDENDEAIAEATKVQTADQIMEAFADVMERFHMTTSPEAISESQEIDELKSDLNEAVNKRAEAEATAASLQKKAIIAEKAHEFDTDTAKEKFLTLAESVEFVDEETYGKKLDVIAESVKPVEKPAEDQLDTDTDTEDDTVVEQIVEGEEEKDSPMSEYLKRF